MRLPDFLIIGAQKSGTTSLYRDLLAQPEVYFPVDKEPACLSSESVLDEQGRRWYGALYRRAKAGQRCGDASTEYSKLPEIAGVPERAAQLLGPELRIVYLVRDPVQRILSQHRHELAEGRVGPDVNEVVRREPRYLDTSRYAFQLSAWRRVMGDDRIRVIPFERYVGDRRGTVAEVARFVGVRSEVGRVEEEVFNRSDQLRPLGRWKGLQESSLYRWVRPRLSPGLRRRMRRALLTEARIRPVPPTESTIRFLIESLREDLAAQPGSFGTRSPFWSEEEMMDRAMTR